MTNQTPKERLEDVVQKITACVRGKKLGGYLESYKELYFAAQAYMQWAEGEIQKLLTDPDYYSRRWRECNGKQKT